jgi:hypothetical protein
LGRQQNIDIEGHGIRCWSASSSGLSPQFRREAKGVIGQRDVSVWGGVHECVKAGDSNSLVSPQKFAFDLVIDDGRNHNSSTGNKTILEPVRYRDYFMTALSLRYQAQRSGIEEKNVAHG